MTKEFGIGGFIPSTRINRLPGLEGALQGVKKSQFPDEQKTELKECYRQHKIKWH